MSVPEGMRSESRLEVCVKASKFAAYVSHCAGNRKKFPEEHAMVAYRLVNSAMAVNALVWEANNIRVDGDPQRAARRLQLQDMAADAINAHLADLEVARGAVHMARKRYHHWSGRAIEVRNLLRKWRESDRRRYGGL